MGNAASDMALSAESKRAAMRFDRDEFDVLRQTFRDLARRKDNHDTIDKETFLQYFPLPGLLGERLFEAFDRSKSGEITYDDFIYGTCILSRGTWDQQLNFVFTIYDADGTGAVSKAELRSILNSLPQDILHEGVAAPPMSGAGTYLSEVDGFTNNDLVEQAFVDCDFDHDGRLTLDQFKEWVTQHPVIINVLHTVLPYAGPPDKPSQRSTRVSVLPFKRATSYGALSRNGSHHSLHGFGLAAGDGAAAPDALSGIKRESFRAEEDGEEDAEGSVAQLKDVFPHGAHALLGEGGLQAHHRARSSSLSYMDLARFMDNEHQVRNLLLQAQNLTRVPAVQEGVARLLELLDEHERRRLEGEEQGDGVAGVVQKEGFLYKRGQHLHTWKSRWYLLSHNCLYYYAHQSDLKSRGLIFLVGCMVEPRADEHEAHGYFGLEIQSTYGAYAKVLYCASAAERDAWVHELRHAAQVVPIEEDYVLGGEIGKGRFSHVLNCSNRHTGEQFAVKVIDKQSMEPEERELLRTEIAIMKLLHHPHIIRMEAVYEDRDRIYIVMEKLSGGELFERIVGRPRFSEAEAFRVIKPLVESVAYLHDMGIVHRDLKPENILCGEDLEDLKIADFGLSKLVLPTDVMKMPCGTLSYVAPEVLIMEGYGRETDVWSTGVIMFLLLRGKLPFDGNDREEIIDRTVSVDLERTMRDDAVWQALSHDARDLILKMLERDPSQRITAKDILRHRWMTAMGAERGADQAPGKAPRRRPAAAAPLAGDDLAP